MAHVAAYWIRDFKVKVYDVSRLSANATARAYRPSRYEHATGYFFRGRPDSAEAEILAHLQSHPLTKSPGTLLANLYLGAGKSQQALQLMRELAERHTTDFDIQFNTAALLDREYQRTRDPATAAAAEEYRRRGRRANPHRTGGAAGPK